MHPAGAGLHFQGTFARVRVAVWPTNDPVAAQLAQPGDNFKLFGNDVIQCFFDVALVRTPALLALLTMNMLYPSPLSQVTGEPLRSRCLSFVHQLGRRWRHNLVQNVRATSTGARWENSPPWCAWARPTGMENGGGANATGGDRRGHRLLLHGAAGRRVPRQGPRNAPAWRTQAVADPATLELGRASWCGR